MRIHLPADERVRDVEILDDPRACLGVEVAKADAEIRFAVRRRRVELVRDRHAVQDVAAEPGELELRERAVRHARLAEPFPLADEKGESLQWLGRLRIDLAISRDRGFVCHDEIARAAVFVLEYKTN